MRISDWSSDVCSSDLDAEQRPHRVRAGGAGKVTGGAREAHLADRQRRIGVGMAEQLEDDLRGKGRGNRLVAQHIEQRILVRFKNQARSEEHTSELQSLMRISYAVFCLKKKTHKNNTKQDKTPKQKTTEQK